MLVSLFTTNAKAQGNFSFSGLESTNFGTIDLSAYTGASWGTDRTATPGYFGAGIGASFSGGSDLYNIDGYVKKYGNEAFTFPVGSGIDLRALSISAPYAATDAYATAWIEGDPSSNKDLTLPNAGPHSITAVTAPIVSVSPVGQWDWLVGDMGNLGPGTTGTGGGLTITVSIPNMAAFDIASDLRLVGWNGTSWIDLSGGPTATGNTENSELSGTMVDSITAIGIGSISAPLPIHIMHFGSAVVNCQARLQWNSLNEINNTQYIVEQSKDGISFKAINVVGIGSSVFNGLYDILIPQPNGLYYYRLLLKDQLGDTVELSNTITCRTNCNTSDKMKVYPNPVYDQPNVNLSITTAYRGKISLLITTQLGAKNIQITK